MILRYATADQMHHWDDVIITAPNGGDVFQTKAFAAIKQSQGWKPVYTIYDINNQEVPCLYLTRRIPLIGELWYAPKGPGVTTVAHMEAVVKANAEFAKGTAIFAFKMEPALAKVHIYPKQLRKVHTIQPNADTVVIDLAPPEDAILATFRQRARRSIRQAQATGVAVRAAPAGTATYQTLYNLYRSTGERAGFHVRPLSYHRALWERWINADQGHIFFAEHQGNVIAAAFVAYIGQNGLYKDGASDRNALQTGAAHLLQWEIMRWLKAHGVTRYDLHGTPPAEELDNNEHRFYGLGLFKTSFSNELTEYAGTLDQPINQAAYKRWISIGERTAQRLEHRLRKRTFY